jgi:peptidoglycan hydrolase-like protein with peptidoglycan-binding domain
MNKKIIASVLAAVFTLSIVAVPVSGATVEELQEQINQLTALIASLQAQLAGQTSTPSTGAVCFHTDLEHGMTSAEVLKLQQTLNLDPATRVATSGAGAPGSETTYFGSLTLAAVKAFQAKHGIITTGYVGPLTRAQLNALYCTPTTPTTVPDETSTTTTTTLAGTEGTLSATAAPVYTETLLKWGTPNQTIYGFKVKAMNSDINLKRIFVKLSANSGLIPWKDLSYISLYDGDNAIKGIEVNSANLVENTYAKDYDVYFDGLNIVVPKGSEKTFTVKVTTASSPENKTAFTIALPQNGVRGLDAAGLNQYNSLAVAGKTVDYEGSRSTGALQVRNNSTTPQKGIILGSDTDVTKDVAIFKFDVKATLNDVTLKEAVINLTQSTSTLVSAVYLFDGDNRLASVAPTATTSAQKIVFPDLSVSIAKDATKTLTVKVDLAKIDGSTVPEESSVSNISTDRTRFSAIDANDNNVTSVTGDATGYNQTVYTAAPVFALIETPILTQDPNTSTQAVATFKVSVTGYGDTIYMSSSTTTFVLESSSTTIATVGTPDISASKSLIGGVYEIGPGETVNFTVEAAVSKGAGSGLASVSMTNIKWGQTSASPAGMNGSAAFDFTDYKTNSVNFY